MNPTNDEQESQRWMRTAARIAPGLVHRLHYDHSWLRGDLMAGVSAAAVALPAGIAYAELTRMPPEIGIYSALFPLLAYALFRSSRQLILGPDAATCILVATNLGPLAGGDPQRPSRQYRSGHHRGSADNAVQTDFHRPGRAFCFLESGKSTCRSTVWT